MDEEKPSNVTSNLSHPSSSKHMCSCCAEKGVMSAWAVCWETSTHGSERGKGREPLTYSTSTRKLADVHLSHHAAYGLRTTRFTEQLLFFTDLWFWRIAILCFKIIFQKWNVAFSTKSSFRYRRTHNWTTRNCPSSHSRISVPTCPTCTDSQLKKSSDSPLWLLPIFPNTIPQATPYPCI